MEEKIYRYVIRPIGCNDPRSASYLADAHALGLHNILALECQDLYFTQGQTSAADIQRVAEELLSDPITQRAQWGPVLIPQNERTAVQENVHIIEVALRPGVTDPVAEQIMRAAKVIGVLGLEKASSGLRFLIQGDLAIEDLHLLTQRLLANNVIQRYTLGEIEPVFPEKAQASGAIETITLRGLSPEALLVASNERRAALDLQEMQAVQAYFQNEGRDPTDVEFETIAQTWSEHCVHKTFRARITVQDPTGATGETVISNLLNTYIKAATTQIGAPWVLSSFVDNAGIIDFDQDFEVSFKVETHNHPSAIEPFGGANTGVGGVIRDVLGVSAKPIAATDVLCFGPADLPLDQLPAGILHPRRIRSGVVAGVQDYGNKIGIPTVSGAVLYDPGYTANPLVFCGCIGLAPKNSHPSALQPGDRVILLGGRTGRDGLRGATFSSMTMDGQTGEVSGAAVQIGDPITEKGLIEVIRRARDLKLYSAITDCGAGGLSSAVGEMGSLSGADVDLAHARLKYPGLAPWEIWLSEAQERMVLSVPPANLAQVSEICRTFDVEMTDIGCFTDTGRLVVRYQGAIVLDLDNYFLHKGIPQRQLQARIPVLTPATPENVEMPATLLAEDANAILLQLLSHPNIASKAPVIRIYDHEVQGGTVVKPLTGAADDGPADACVLKPAGTSGKRGIVLSAGVNPQYGKFDAYRMACSVVDEAVRNAVAVGANPQRIALLDNFCWGDPRRPETMGSLVQAAQGCYDAAIHYQAPFISGKDSLNNEYLGMDGERHAIPPTLLVSALGIIDDITRAVTLDLKTPGNAIYLLGEFQPSFRGSHYEMISGTQFAIETVPGLPPTAPILYQALHQAMQMGLVRACHDISEGGVSTAAAEMCIAGRLGMSLSLPTTEPLHALFGEINGCLLVEVTQDQRLAFEKTLQGFPCMLVGAVIAEQALSIHVGTELFVYLKLPDLLQAWSPANPLPEQSSQEKACSQEH